MSNSQDNINTYIQKYRSGKQSITLIVNIIVLIGYLLEIINYFNIYSQHHFTYQLINCTILIITLVLHFINKDRYYALGYLIVSYSVIIHILFSTIAFPEFFDKIPFSRSDFFSRNMFFIICFIAIVGFIKGKWHIIVQGSLLLSFVTIELFVVKDAFIINSAPLYYLTTIGFCWVMTFVVNILDKFLVRLNLSNNEIIELQKISELKKETLEKYNIAIIELSKKTIIGNDTQLNETNIFEKIVETAAQNLNCTRVSIWLLSSDKKSIFKKTLYDNGKIDNASTELFQKDFPIYFESFINLPYIDAALASIDVRTNELRELYLRPLKIKSMLDCSIKLNNTTIGVICCENQIIIRNWEQEDILFVQSISEYVAIHLKNIEIQSLLLKIKNKNTEILDSINYAKRLQSAILPPPNLIDKYFSNSFIIYKPKDIVAGDFYWMEVIGENIIFALADCTGHGVPGAIVSVVCHNALNRAVKDLNIIDPAEILNKTRELVIEQFEKSEESVSDGMDISLLVYNKNSQSIKWAGANSPLLLYSGGELIKYTPNKQPVGNFFKQHPFTSHKINLKIGDIVYLYSDGYIDQFGGPKEKKFYYSKLSKLIIENNNNTMSSQKIIFEKAFTEWKGNNEQIDDVCLIGIKF